MSHTETSPVARLYAIVEQGLCIGCGLCQAIAGPESIDVTKTANGYERPVVIGELSHSTVDTIYDVCPGTRLDGLPESLTGPATEIHPIWGPWQRIVRAWAAEPAVRHIGSTGGVLTALGQYLLRTEQVSFVLHAKASKTNPTFGERTLSFSEAEVLEAAGSRYGPTAPLIDITDVLDRGQPFAFIAKPCDLSALRNWARHDERVDQLVKYWLSPVCGGFFPPESTERVIREQRLDPRDITAFRYRGHGCPGPTRLETADQVREIHYLDMWGEDESTWQLPWRCKICPDGIGEVADIVAGDSWVGGSPDRAESETDPGVNAVIARTTIGRDLLESASRDGALVIERDIGPDDMSSYQPHQVAKKYSTSSRYRGLADAGRIVPTTHRLRLDLLAAELSPEQVEAQRSGTRSRVAIGKASEPEPLAVGSTNEETCGDS